MAPADLNHTCKDVPSSYTVEVGGGPIFVATVHGHHNGEDEQFPVATWFEFGGRQAAAVRLAFKTLQAKGKSYIAGRANLTTGTFTVLWSES